MNGFKLLPILRYVRRHQTLQSGWITAQQTAWITPISCIVILVLGRLIPISNLLSITLIPPILWLCANIIYTFLSIKPFLDVAKSIDMKLDLKEKLSTAFEYEQVRSTPQNENSFPKTPNLRDIQYQDAYNTARSIDPQKAFPLLWLRRPTIAALGFLVVVLGLVLLPNPMDVIIAEREAINRATQVQTDKLENIRNDIARSEELSPDKQISLLRQLDELTENLRQNPGNLELALADLSKLENALHRDLDQNSDLSKASLEAITSQLQALAIVNKYPTTSSNEILEFISSNLDDMDPLERQELAEVLANMAAQAAQAGNQSLAKALANMSQATISGSSETVHQAASEVSESLIKTQQELQDQRSIQQVLSQVQNSSQVIAQAGSGNQETAGQGLNSNGSGENQGQGQNGSGKSGGGTKADTLPPGTGRGQANHPEEAENYRSAGELIEKESNTWNRLSNNGQEIWIPGLVTDQGETIARDTPNTSSGIADPILIPYQQVYAQYSETAQQAINHNIIPSEYKDLVREYFSQLEP